jgi:hypothetical protein
VRDIYGAATRLNVIGCYESCKLQASAHELIKNFMAAKDFTNDCPIKAGQTERGEAENEFDDMWSDTKGSCDLRAATTAPILNILQSRHDILYSKLFNT